MIYGQRAPHPYLEEFVECYWAVEQKEGDSLILPDGCSDIIFQRWHDGSSEVHFVGLQTKARLVIRRKACQYFGLRLKGHGAKALLGGQARELIDQSVSLKELDLPFSFQCKEEWSGEQFLRSLEMSLVDSRAKSNVKLQPIVAATAELLKENQFVSVAQLAERLSVSRQYMTRAFKNDVGLSPNQYMQTLCAARATRLMSHTQRPDWARLALELGFYDQSHFIASFKKITGFTPETYRRLNA